MSLAQPSAPERQPSPGLTLNLASNNPFRNVSSSSPAMPSPSMPNSGGRPVSRNPFLASFEQDANMQTTTQQQSPRKIPVGGAGLPVPRTNTTLGGDDLDLFDRLTLTASNPNPINRNMGPPSGRMPPPNGIPGNGPRRSGEDNRPRLSGEEMRRPLPAGARQGPAPQRRPAGDGPRLPPGAGERRPSSRPRRNSESSVAERPPMSEEDRRRRERRRREEYERRKRAERADKGEPDDGQTRTDKPKVKDDKPKSSSRREKRQHGLDIIDKLDVTGIYGAGVFHHDGPFDACNPHRNRRRDMRAPIQAFPVGSANMAMGGGPPVNKQFDIARYHGVTDEGFKDYGVGYQDNSKLRPAGVGRTQSFDPTARTEPIHGEESMGLGTSTFLEGAPASRKAIERRESESDPAQTGANGAPMLSRKKSLAQRIRGISAPRTRAYGEGPLQSPEIRNGGGLSSPGSPPGAQPMPATGVGKIPAVGSRRVQSAASNAPDRKSEQNPFDNLYDDAYDKKGASIKAAEKARAASSSGPSGPSQSFSRKIVPTQLEDRPMPENDQIDSGEIVGGPRSTIARVRALSSPRRGTGLDRIDDEGRDSTDGSEDFRREVKSSSGGGGLLTRMKSLKKSSRPTRPS